MGVAWACCCWRSASRWAPLPPCPSTDGFTHPLWTPVVLVGYALSIWMLAIVVRQIPVSVAYAIWAGLGTAAIAVVGVMVLGEHWDVTKVAALTLIIVGVVVLNLHGAH